MADHVPPAPIGAKDGPEGGQKFVAIDNVVKIITHSSRN